MSPVRIKCCGITRIEDALAAARLGFDAVGLVFARGSRRVLDLDQARRIRDALPSGITPVALFMDNPVDEVQRVIAAVDPQILQFHGNEADSFCGQFGLPYLKSVAMGEGAAALSALRHHPGAAALLLDGNVRGQAGGRGESFDWSLVAGRMTEPWILAGGLDADNVAAAVRLTRPWGVDVSSGVESSPGCKDPDRMKRFVDAVRGVETHFSQEAP